MRPNRQTSDLEYWTQAKTYWLQQAEHWFLEGARAKDPEWEARVGEWEQNARANAEKADWKHQEACGLIEVYTGRPKPKWCV